MINNEDGEWWSLR